MSIYLVKHQIEFVSVSIYITKINHEKIYKKYIINSNDISLNTLTT